MPYARVALDLPVPEGFDYEIPEALVSAVTAGVRVRVPFGSRELEGVCLATAPTTEIARVKPILTVLPGEPVSAEMLDLARFAAGRFVCGPGEILEASVPRGARRGVKGRPAKDAPPPAALERPLLPTPAQAAVIARILDAVRHDRHETFLLHGVTGSGKTEVYLAVIAEALARGRAALALVPEISLTPQTVGRFRARFGDRVAVLHSHLAEGARADAWRAIASGERDVVVGARSAVFAPVERIGVIVIDEEHDGSYKQESSPRYHARDIALWRAARHAAPVILGSATPSLESYAAAVEEKRFVHLELPERIGERPLPPVEVIDLTKEPFSGRGPSRLSRPLVVALERVLAAKEQAILFLNRRGHSTYLSCRSCGHVETCAACSVTLTLHKQEKALICHYCGKTLPAPSACPACNSEKLTYSGIGTERVEEEIRKLFPAARVARMDRDTTHGAHAHEEILERFRTGQADILIGTQMITKGLDFPNVTLVGVVLADTAINLPDFRAGERTFQLLTQVAGRSGRSDKGGRVLIQSYTADHPAIQYAARHDFLGFAREELAVRRQMGYPPYRHIARILVSGRDEKKCMDAATDIRAKIESAGFTDASSSPIPRLSDSQTPGLCDSPIPRLSDSQTRRLADSLVILGPAEAPLARLKGKYRVHLLLKAERRETLEGAVRVLRPALRARGRTQVTVDVDPQALL
ncbi:MAG: primosomal protein N' [Planctomycetota bacterium]